MLTGQIHKHMQMPHTLLYINLPKIKYIRNENGNSSPEAHPPSTDT